MSYQERLKSFHACGIIANTDPSYKPGEHCIALSIWNHLKVANFLIAIWNLFNTFPSPPALSSVARLSFLVYPPYASPASCQERRRGTSQFLNFQVSEWTFWYSYVPQSIFTQYATFNLMSRLFIHISPAYFFSPISTLFYVVSASAVRHRNDGFIYFWSFLSANFIHIWC